ncbi:MAG: hypothetical protein WCK86_14615 [Planctomycetia bacterium]
MSNDCSNSMDEGNKRFSGGRVETSDSRQQDAVEGSTVRMFLDGLLYGVSLPERFVRSAVGLTAGTAKEIAEFIVPQAFQSSKSYEVAIRNSLNFLLSNVATISETGAKSGESAPAVPAGLMDSRRQVSGTTQESAGTSGTETDAGRFVAKKAISNFIDITGLTTLHVSPLWILAIVSDTAYGTKVYLNELAVELQRQGLIDNSSTIHKVDDVFEAVRKASSRAASTFDLPPLSLLELKQSLTQTRAALQEIDPAQLIPESEIRRLWQEMKELAVSENISLLGVSGALAMQTVKRIRGATQGTLAGLFVAGKIINRNIFGHYEQALIDVHQRGILQSVRDSFEPYADLAWNNMESSRKTWTEQLLNPSLFGRAWNVMKGLVGGGS